MCLLEGEHLAQSYAQNGRRLSQLVLRAESTHVTETSIPHAHRVLANAADETILLSPGIFDSLSTLSTPGGVLAIASVTLPPPLARGGFVLALDVVQDPGNVGTLIRTAAAAGASQVWLSRDCAFAWSTKTLRASQGAHFHIDVIEGVNLVEALNAFCGERWATLPRPRVGMPTSMQMHSLSTAAFGAEVALIVSNEGAGLAESLFGALTHGLSIPMSAGIESLNVASAGAIALYAIAMQRRQHK